MYTKQLKDEKGKETLYAKDSRLVYCIARYNDTYNELTVQYFADNFKEILDNIGFEWHHKNYPSADQIRNNWFERWQWEESAKQYTQDILEEDDLIHIYHKSNAKHIRELYKLRDDLRSELHKIIHHSIFDNHNEKQNAITKCITSLDKVEKDIRLLLGLSTSNNNVDANVDNHVTLKDHAENIFVFSPDEMKRVMNIKNIDEETQEFLDKI